MFGKIYVISTCILFGQIESWFPFSRTYKCLDKFHMKTYSQWKINRGNP
jgi:hypothetical protein